MDESDAPDPERMLNPPTEQQAPVNRELPPLDRREREEEGSDSSESSSASDSSSGDSSEDDEVPDPVQDPKRRT